MIKPSTMNHLISATRRRESNRSPVKSCACIATLAITMTSAASVTIEAASAPSASFSRPAFVANSIHHQINPKASVQSKVAGVSQPLKSTIEKSSDLLFIVDDANNHNAKEIMEKAVVITAPRQVQEISRDKSLAAKLVSSICKWRMAQGSATDHSPAYAFLAQKCRFFP